MEITGHFCAYLGRTLVLKLLFSHLDLAKLLQKLLSQTACLTLPIYCIQD